MKILAIESSCDETAVAILEIKNNKFKILANVISSQVKVHAKYGGIVPEVAARLHIKNMLPIFDLALRKAKCKKDDINAIAVTTGPGLVSSLMVGVETAKSLAYAWQKPLIKVNHIEGHILSSLAENKKIKFPAVALVVSGGHTQIILVKDFGKYKLIGQTRDDAVGEAFDKTAKILALGYPGGPIISKLAEKRYNKKFNIKLPRPMISSNNFDMSFSGLKTAVLYAWQNIITKIAKKDLDNLKFEIATEFQDAVVDVLISKTLKAVQEYKAKTLILGGGVSANKLLINSFKEKIETQFNKVDFLYPELELTGDNAVMIGVAGYYHYKNKDFIKPFKLKADPNWELV